VPVARLRRARPARKQSRFSLLLPLIRPCAARARLTPLAASLAAWFTAGLGAVGAGPAWAQQAAPAAPGI